MIECLDPEVVLALARVGLRARSFAPISTIRSAAIGRAAYRIELENGHTIKARRLPDEAAARRLFEIRRQLPAAFAPALALHGSVLLEEWIEGEGLGQGCPSEARLTEAAAVLAALHAIKTVGGQALHELRSTADWRHETERGLREIVATGGFDEQAAMRIRAALERRDPAQAIVGLVHTDFCGDNMVIDRAGRLRVIDNERVSVDALGYDVGRAWYRWALPSNGWERFRSAYAARMPFREPYETLGFWSIVAVVKSAVIRVRWDRVRAHVPLGRLVALAAEFGDHPTPEAGE